MDAKPTESTDSPSPDDVCDPTEAARAGRFRRTGLIAAPFCALALYFLIPDATAAAPHAHRLTQPGRVTAAVAMLMAVLWVTEALPVFVTALLPIVLFPLLTGGRVTVSDATAPYAHELIFLFLGGFMLARAMERWGLHRRIALQTVRIVGTRPSAVVGGFMLAAAMLSMWVSNTATVIMMLPIAMSVVDMVRRRLDPGRQNADSDQAPPLNFAICLLLGTAYAASIGGIGTLIGTPPNALLAAYAKNEFGVEITFVRWMGVGLPLVILFLPLTWLLLTRWIYPIDMPRIPGGRALVQEHLDALGPMARAERRVLIVFTLTALAWIFRPALLRLFVPADSAHAPITDAGIAMAAAVALFVIPAGARPGACLMHWKETAGLPWGVLLLFGGGLSLAAGLSATGVTDYVGRYFAASENPPTLLIVLGVTAAVVFLTELTSNTATAAALLPILGAAAVGLDISPLMLTIPAAMGASCAFMMPVATPPNAIVFSSGEITIPQMCKAGLWLNFAGILLILGVTYGLVIRVFST